MSSLGGTPQAGPAPQESPAGEGPPAEEVPPASAPRNRSLKKKNRWGYHVEPGDRDLEASLRRIARHALSYAAGQQASMHLWWVTLGFHDSELALFDPAELTTSWPWSCAELFAARIGSESPYSGAMLVLDLGSQNLRPHFHGLVQTESDQLSLDQLWGKLGRHCPDPSTLGQRIKQVRWSVKAPWHNILDNKHRLLPELRRTINYASKALPAGANLSLHQRLLRSGVFETYVAAAGTCPQCGGYLNGRAQTCKGSCRVARSRARR